MVKVAKPNLLAWLTAAALAALAGGGAAPAQAVEPPELSQIAATHVSDTTAVLQASIDPMGSATAYHFEYGLDSTYGTSIPADLEGDGGSQEGAAGVFEHISGLQPGTTYHFRLAASNAGDTVESADLVFTTRTVAEVTWPSRGIELINPPDKGNQNARPGYAADDLNPSPEAMARSVSSDGAEVVWGTAGGGPESTSGVGLYLARRTATGWRSQGIVPEAEEQAGEGDKYYAFEAASRDFSTYVLVAEEGVTGFNLNSTRIYERVTRAGDHEVIDSLGSVILRSVAISADGKRILYENPVTNQLIGFENGGRQILPTPSCGYTIPAIEWTDYADPNDLSRVFVESSGNEASCESPGIYLVDRSAGTVTNVAPGGSFLRTNEDGSAVVYLKEGNAYRWSELDGIKCLTCGLLPPGVEVSQAVVSEDLSHVYFASNSVDEDAITRADIWVADGEAVEYVAAVTNFEKSFALKTTPDGTAAVFNSIAGTTADATGWDGLTGFGSTNAREQAELYRYSEESGYVECVSCRGTAEPAEFGVAGAPGRFSLSDDGSTIAYGTAARLVPEDINGSLDIYEWHNGITRLISDGETQVETETTNVSGLWGASRDGRTVVFAVAADLTGSEDGFVNAYAAVVGATNGSATPAAPAPCVEDACQGPLQSPPFTPAIGSAVFTGPENPVHRRKHRKRRHKTHHRHGRAHRGQGGGSR